MILLILQYPNRFVQPFVSSGKNLDIKIFIFHIIRIIKDIASTRTIILSRNSSLEYFPSPSESDRNWRASIVLSCWHSTRKGLRYYCRYVILLINGGNILKYLNFLGPLKEFIIVFAGYVLKIFRRDQAINPGPENGSYFQWVRGEVNRNFGNKTAYIKFYSFFLYSLKYKLIDPCTNAFLHFLILILIFPDIFRHFFYEFSICRIFEIECVPK